MSSKEVTFCNGDDVWKVQTGANKLIIDKSVKNVPEGYLEYSSFLLRRTIEEIVKGSAKEVPEGIEEGYERYSSFAGRETIEEVIIEEGVESIGKYSFSKCENLETVTYRLSGNVLILKKLIYPRQTSHTSIVVLSFNVNNSKESSSHQHLQRLAKRLSINARVLKKLIYPIRKSHTSIIRLSNTVKNSKKSSSHRQ